jgi:hypothetical protein
MKAGTTSLYEYLTEHPQIEMPRVKEPNYFVEELNWTRGQRWYEEQFANVSAGRLTGDFSTNYSKYPAFDGVPERMARVLREVKLIYVMRDPVARMRSHWMHSVNAGIRRKPLAETLLGESHFRDCSSYAIQLERYLAHFPRERMLLLTAEELQADREHTLKQVFEFLGVAVDVPAGVNARNRQASATKRVPQRGSEPARPFRPDETELSEADERKLRELLRPDMERLARYMPAGFDAWGILR